MSKLSRHRRILELCLGLAALTLSSASCRQPVCADSETCLRVDVDTQLDSSSPNGFAMLDIVLLDKSCQALGRFNATPSSLHLPGQFEVQLNSLPSSRTNAQPIPREAIAHAVAIAWPSAQSTPWSGRTLVENLGEGFHVSVAPPQVPNKKFTHSSLQDFTNINDIKATRTETGSSLVIAGDVVKCFPFNLTSNSSFGVSFTVEAASPGVNFPLIHGHNISDEFAISYLSSSGDFFSSSMTNGECDKIKPSELIISPGLAMKSVHSWWSKCPDISPEIKPEFLFIDSSDPPNISIFGQGCNGTPINMVASTLCGSKDVIAINSYPKNNLTEMFAVIDNPSSNIFRLCTLQRSVSAWTPDMPLNLQLNSRPIGLEFADLDRDGNPEGIIAAADGQLQIIELKKDDSGWMLDGSLSLVGTTSNFAFDITKLSVGDFNGDTLTDIALSNGDEAHIRLGNGHGGFAADQVLTLAKDSKVMDVADLNNNCSDELIFGLSNAKFEIFSADK